MARREGGGKVQTELQSIEELEIFLKQDSIVCKMPEPEQNYKHFTHFSFLVLDVYSEAFGPCIPMVSFLRNFKLLFAGDALQLAAVGVIHFGFRKTFTKFIPIYPQASADNIDALRRFRNKSEPVYLVIAVNLFGEF